MPTELLSQPCTLTTGQGEKEEERERERERGRERDCSLTHTCYLLHRGGGPSVAKTLDLLKAVLQPSFNQELKRLCDDYVQIFTLAANNIRENTRDNVPEATLRVLVHKMMEEVCTHKK